MSIFETVGNLVTGGNEDGGLFGGLTQVLGGKSGGFLGQVLNGIPGVENVMEFAQSPFGQLLVGALTGGTSFGLNPQTISAIAGLFES